MLRSSDITFKTINNRLDPIQLAPDEMSVAENIVIGDDNSISRRQGRTLSVATENPHSLWSSSDGENTYYVASGMLMRLYGDMTTTAVGMLSYDEPLSYEPVNNIVVVSNGLEIKFINKSDELHDFSTPDENHKIALRPGRFIAFFRGRLYVLCDEGLYYSDPYAVQQMDERSCLIPLEGEPTMLIALDDCLWVGKGDKTIRILGKNPEEFTYKEFSSKVVPYSAKAIDRTSRFKLSSDGRFCVWTSADGICIGSNSGKYSLVTEEFLSVKKADFAASFIREEQGMAHYITSLHGTTTPRNQFDPASIEVNSIHYSK